MIDECAVGALQVHKYNTRSQAELTDPRSPMLMTKLRSQVRRSTTWLS
jgi:hypothetical protein